MNTTASDLIARSVSHTEIVSAPWTADLADGLLAECEDNIEASETVHEYWGTDADGAEWRVHLHGVRGRAVIRCGCGEWSGEPCEWSGPRSETVVVEWMPDQHRSSHEAAGSRGSYPGNGAQRARVSVDCYEHMRAEDGDWIEQVSDA